MPRVNEGVGNRDDKVWTIELDGSRHTVELEHGYFSGKRTIRVDGELVAQAQKLLDTGGQHPFQIGEHSCAAVVRTNGITFNYDLVVDGRSIETGQVVSPPEPIPGWAWLFIVACGIIPIVSLGGAIPTAIGIGGAVGCATIARNSSMSLGVRGAICVGIVVLCWVLFFALVAGSVFISGS